MNFKMIDPIFYVVGFAFLSCISRSGLNIIDRQSLGIKKVPIHEVMLINTVLPSVIAVLASASAGMLHMVMVQFLDWRSFAFSVVVQIVAYSFSYAFRGHHVEDVVISAKSPEAFVSLVYFLPLYSISSSSVIDLTLAGLISTVCIAFLLSCKASRTLWIVPACLLLQASLSPFLLPSIFDEGLEGSMSFGVATLLWRAVFSIAFSLRSPLRLNYKRPTSQIDALFLIRGILAVTTQVCLILSLSFEYPEIAWSILNLTGSFSRL